MRIVYLLKIPLGEKFMQNKLEITKNNQKIQSQELSPFAEVIESSLEGWVAQSWKWDMFPAFGSLVTIQDAKKTWFGLVYQIKTGSLDPHRAIFTYQKTADELLQDQPHIFEFLSTRFSCLTIGFKLHNKIYYQRAPEPPKIHAFVKNGSLDEKKQFFSSSAFLPLIFNTPDSSTSGNIDELFLALVYQQAQAGLLSEKKLLELIETFSLLTGNDYRRNKILLKRIELCTQ